MRSRFLRALVVAGLGSVFAATPAAATVTSGVTPAGVLTVSSDGADPITVDCQSGVVKINNLNPDAPGGPVACSAITESHVFGGPGANTITLTNVAPAFFPALASSEIQGFGDSDSVTGSGIADTVTGGIGTDDLAGGGGDDVFLWNPGDGSDDIRGEGDSDAMIVNGSGTDEIFTVNADGLGVDVLRNVGSIILDIDTTELVVLNALGGADTITSNSLAGTLTTLAMNGGADGDELNGSDMGDMLDGGAGTDEVHGNSGNDTLLIRDSTPDTATCGDGTDSVTADAQTVDSIAGDCENLDVPLISQPPAGPPPDVAQDTAPPDTQITASPKAKTKQKQAAFAFSGTDARAVASFQCRLDGDPFAACSSPFEAKVGKGKHSFEVRAVDAAGNVDPTPASYAWTVKKKKRGK
jgi:hypothetical protein